MVEFAPIEYDECDYSSDKDSWICIKHGYVSLFDEWVSVPKWKLTKKIIDPPPPYPYKNYFPNSVDLVVDLTGSCTPRGSHRVRKWSASIKYGRYRIHLGSGSVSSIKKAKKLFDDMQYLIVANVRELLSAVFSRSNICCGKTCVYKISNDGSVEPFCTSLGIDYNESNFLPIGNYIVCRHRGEDISKIYLNKGSRITERIGTDKYNSAHSWLGHPVEAVKNIYYR